MYATPNVPSFYIIYTQHVHWAVLQLRLMHTYKFRLKFNDIYYEYLISAFPLLLKGTKLIQIDENLAIIVGSKKWRLWTTGNRLSWVHMERDPDISPRKCPGGGNVLHPHGKRPPNSVRVSIISSPIMSNDAIWSMTLDFPPIIVSRLINDKIGLSPNIAEIAIFLHISLLFDLQMWTTSLEFQHDIWFQKTRFTMLLESVNHLLNHQSINQSINHKLFNVLTKTDRRKSIQSTTRIELKRITVRNSCQHDRAT